MLDPEETALPDQVSPPEPEGRSGSGTHQEAGPSGESGDRGNQLPGLPRLFFAEEDLARVRTPVDPAGRPAEADPAEHGQAGPGSQAGPGNRPWSPGEPGQAPGQPAGQLPAWPPGGAFGTRSVPPPGGAGSGPGARRAQPTRQPDRELRQRAVAALTLGAVAMFAAMAALFSVDASQERIVYLLGFSALVGIAALAIGITAIRKARHTEAFRPRGAVGAIILGSIAMVLTVPMLLLLLTFPTQIRSYISCQAQAQTTAAQQACFDQFSKSIQSVKP